MGHYRADLACDTCGQVTCICAKEDEKPNTNWIVDDDFSVIQVCDFDRKYATIKTKHGSMPGHPLIRRANKKQYKTRKAVEKAARKQCEQAVDIVRQNLLELKHLLKVERPWEKK